MLCPLPAFTLVARVSVGRRLPAILLGESHRRFFVEPACTKKTFAAQQSKPTDIGD